MSINDQKRFYILSNVIQNFGFKIREWHSLKCHVKNQDCKMRFKEIKGVKTIEIHLGKNLRSWSFREFRDDLLFVDGDSLKEFQELYQICLSNFKI